MKEFSVEVGIEGREEIFRSALRSYAAWVMEKARPKSKKTVLEQGRNGGIVGVISSHEEGVEDYASRMREIIERV